jgi:uncharacterized protein (DUF1330 family)
MEVNLVYEWFNAKDTERLHNYMKLIDKVTTPYVGKLIEKGICKTTGLADNSGRMMSIWSFENAEAFGKLWNDPEYHSIMIKLNQLTDNMTIRICRPSRPIVQEEIS